MNPEARIIDKIDARRARANTERRHSPAYKAVIASVAAYARQEGPGEAWGLLCRLCKVHQIIHARSGRERADEKWAAATKGRAA